MAISDQQLETWSSIGASAQSKTTYVTIKTTLERTDAPYIAAKSYSIHLQGSYGNNTNVYRDSDVDVVITTSSVYYSDTSSLSADHRVRFDSTWSAASYSASDFKNDVAIHLKARFGQAVDAPETRQFSSPATIPDEMLTYSLVRNSVAISNSRTAGRTTTTKASAFFCLMERESKITRKCTWRTVRPKIKRPTAGSSQLPEFLKTCAIA